MAVLDDYVEIDTPPARQKAGPPRPVAPDDYVEIDRGIQPMLPGQQAPDDYIEIASPEARSPFQSLIGDPWQTGMLQAGNTWDVAQNLVGLKSAEEVERMQYMRSQEGRIMQPNANDAALMQSLPGKSAGDVMATIFSNPQLLLQLPAQMLPNMAVSAGMGAAGGLIGTAIAPGIGTAIGMGLGSGLGSFGTDFSQTAMETAMSNPRVLAGVMDVSDALKDPNIMANAKMDALQHAGPVGIFDALSAGVAGKLGHLVSGALGGRLGAKLAGGAAEVASQGAYGATGEGLGQYANRGEIYQPGAVTLEAAMEVMGLPGELATTALGDMMAQRQKQAMLASRGVNTGQMYGPSQPGVIQPQMAPGAAPAGGGVVPPVSMQPAGTPSGTVPPVSVVQPPPPVTPEEIASAIPVDLAEPPGMTPVAPSGPEEYIITGAISAASDDERTRVEVLRGKDGKIGGLMGPAGIVRIDPGDNRADMTPEEAIMATFGSPEYSSVAPANGAAAKPVETAEPPDLTPVEEPAPAPAEPSGPLEITVPYGDLDEAAQAEAETAPPESPPQGRGKADGTYETDRSWTPNGKFEVPSRLEVVEAEELESATGPDQPRARGKRQALGGQVREIASQLNFHRMYRSPELSSGAPLVDENGVVLSGNGRHQALMQAADQHPEQYAKYRADLEAQGYDLTGMKMPILVRRPTAPIPEEARADFAIAANKPQGAVFSEPEQAMIDARSITPEMLELYDPDVEEGVAAAANRPFLRAFRQTLDPNEQPAFETESGKRLSPQGQTRLENALLARAYGNPELVRAITEADENKTIRNALSGVAGAWARMREQAPEWDITQHLVAGLQLFNEARRNKQWLDNFIDQVDLERAPPDPLTVAAARLFANENGSRFARDKVIAERLRSYVNQALDASTGTENMLGESRTPESVLADLGETSRRQKGTEQEEPPAADPGGLFGATPVAPKPKRAAPQETAGGMFAAPTTEEPPGLTPAPTEQRNAEAHGQPFQSRTLEPEQRTAQEPEGLAELETEANNYENAKPPEEIFPKPARTIDADKNAGPVLSEAKADAIVDGWKAEAKRIGETQDNGGRVIISLFDASGSWSQPWRDAGYTVLQYDSQLGDDIFNNFPIADIMDVHEIDPEGVVGVLAATPCTTFAASGARWWESRHGKNDPELVEEMFGKHAAEAFDTPVEANTALVHATEAVIEFANPQVFHVMENPIGRIAEMSGLPAPLMRFNPNTFGDPYTKRTQLFGDFSTELPTAPVEATEGSKMQAKLGSANKFERSLTPDGFAYSFFMAQHAAIEAKMGPAPPRTEESPPLAEQQQRRLPPEPIPGEAEMIAEEEAAAAAEAGEPAPKPKKPKKAKKAKLADAAYDTKGVEKHVTEAEEDDGKVLADRRRRAKEGRNKLSREAQQATFTHDAPLTDKVWEDMGVDPDRGNNLPARDQMRILGQQLQKKYGFKGVKYTGANPRDVIDQMKDAYVQLEGQAFALGLPISSISLNGRLSISFETRARSYFGAYQFDPATIRLPGRTNSWGHEWAHAVDHYLLDLSSRAPVRAKTYAQLARTEGLDPALGVDAAFINLLNTLFFNDAELGQKLLALETRANAINAKTGLPTADAVKAQEQIDNIRAGKGKPNTKGTPPVSPSDFRAKAKQLDAFNAGNPYYSTAHELVARSFEAFFAAELEGSNMQSRFLNKTAQAYFNAADQRLQLAYPDAGDRMRQQTLWRELFDQLRREQTFGTQPAPGRPSMGTLNDANQYVKQVFEQEMPKATEALANETKELQKAFQKNAAKVSDVVRKSQDAVGRAELKKGIMDAAGVGLRVASDTLRILHETALYYLGTTRSYAMLHIERSLAHPDANDKKNSGKWQQFAAGMVMDFHGQDVLQTGSLERVKKRLLDPVLNQLTAALIKAERHGLALSKDDQLAIRTFMRGDATVKLSKAQTILAGEFRRIMDDFYRKLQNAGHDMGFVQYGFLPRMMDFGRVQQNLNEFQGDAETAYLAEFQRDRPTMKAEEILSRARAVQVAASPLDKAARPFKPEVKAFKRASRALAQAQANVENNPGDPAFEQALDDAQDDFDDAREALLDAIHQPWAALSALHWRNELANGRGGTLHQRGLGASITKERQLGKEADAILDKWYEQDPLIMVINYAVQAANLLAADETIGNPAGNEYLDEVLKRPKVRDEIAADKAKYNLDTVAGRIAIVRDLTDGREDNRYMMALRQADADGTTTQDSNQAMRDVYQNVTGLGGKGNNSSIVNRVVNFLYAYGTLRLLSRSVLTALSEPLTIYLRTGNAKATLAAITSTVGQLARNSKTAKEAREWASTMHIIASPLYDTFLHARLGTDGVLGGSNVIINRFMTNNWQTAITNAQLRGVAIGGFTWMRDMAQQWEVATGKRKDYLAGQMAAEFRELGIDNDMHATMRDWLIAHDTIPSFDEMQTREGQLFTLAMQKFVTQVIQHPTRADKPMAANSSLGKLAYQLTSFLYAFTANVHAATVHRAKRNYALAQEVGYDKGKAFQMAGGTAFQSLAMGFAGIFVAQLLTATLRESLFNREQWDKHKKEGNLQQWLISLAMSRTSILGVGDIGMNMLTGIRYERDASNTVVGPALSSILGDVKSMVQLYQENSINTPTNERNAAIAFYNLVVAPTLVLALNQVNTVGPVTNAARWGLMGYLSSSSAAKAWADQGGGTAIADALAPG